MEKCALIPAYNEEDTIEEVIKRLKKVGLKSIVVDDCSEDKTNEIAKKVGAITLKHEINKGKGEALKTGINYILKKHPETRYIVLIDADLQYLPEESIRLLKPLEEGKADLVTGYRNWVKVPFRHKLGNFVWRKAFNILFGTKFKDTNCGFMALNKKGMKKIKNCLHGGYIIENTIFVEALKNNLKIKQVPVTVIYKRKSGVIRGMRIVLGVFIFILKKGISFRLRI